MSQDYMPVTQFSPHAFISAISQAETMAVFDKALRLWEANKLVASGEDRRNVEDAIERQKAYIAKKNAAKADDE